MAIPNGQRFAVTIERTYETGQPGFTVVTIPVVPVTVYVGSATLDEVLDVVAAELRDRMRSEGISNPEFTLVLNGTDTTPWFA